MLWTSAVTNNTKLHCLVNADQLPQDVCNEILDHLESTIQGNYGISLFLGHYIGMCISIGFKIAILVCKENQSKNNIVSRLKSHLRDPPSLPKNEKITQYVSSHIEQLRVKFTDVFSDHER